MIASLGFLSAPELEALNPKVTVFLFPIGGVEQHGPHLPLGTKLFEAEEMAKALARELEQKLDGWNFILMPLLPLSIDSHTNRIALNVRPHVVRDAVVDQCEELKRLRFSNFIAVSSHLTPKQLTALEDAGKIVSRKAWFGSNSAGLISVSGASVDAKKVWESPLISLPKEHAGEYETGLMLKWNPSLLAKAYASLEARPSPKASAGRFIAHLKHELDGYWGNPAIASEQQAQTQFQTEIRLLAERVQVWLTKGKGEGLFRSGYHYIPLNGSFFKTYFLALIFFVTMLVGVIWSVRDMFEK